MSLSRKGRLGAALGTAASTATILTLFLTLGQSGSSPAAPPTQVPTTPVAYPANVDQNYLSSCEQTSNGNVAYCQCTLNWFQNNVTYTQFLADEDILSNGQTPADLTQAENSCN
jgi:hypothetical protein